MLMTGGTPRRARPMILGVLALLGLLAVAAGGLAEQASAANAGQTGIWGIQGPADGHLSTPYLIAAEENGSVLISDRPDRSGSNPFRLQKFSSTGAFEGTVTIPTPGGEVFAAMAVDSAAHRVYLLRAKAKSDPVTGKALAEEILVFSTIPNPTSHALEAVEAPGGGPLTFPLPVLRVHACSRQ